MPVSDVLKNFRKDGYSPAESSAKPKEEAGGARMIKLTDDEAKGLASYGGAEGKEITCQVTGRLNGSDLSVISVSSPDGGEGGPGDEKEMAAKVMGMMGKPPMMPS